MFVRPARGLRHGPFGLLARGVLTAALGFIAAPSRADTQLTLDTFAITQANGTALPIGVAKSASALLLPGGTSVTMNGGFGPFLRQTWQQNLVQTVRVSMSGKILGGVEAGDDVQFVYSMTIIPTGGTVSWNAQGNANVPPSTGFFGGRNGSVAGPGIVSGSFGGVLVNGSAGQGTWSAYIDFMWSGATVVDTLTVSVDQLTVHLPTPGTLALAGVAGALWARRRR